MHTVEDITVNTVRISSEQIHEEMQYHPAETLSQATLEAAKYLVIRELLIQRVKVLDMASPEEMQKNPDPFVEQLLEKEMRVPVPDDATCQRYYHAHQHRFFTSPIVEVAHILYLAPPEDQEKYAQAKAKAENALQRIRANPASFAQIAQDESACSSASDGGHLGQISKGQTLPAFEAAVFKMHAGDISVEPVASSVGYHVIRVINKAEGKALDYASVASWISQHLVSTSTETAFDQYIRLLAGQATITGFSLPSADTPLMQ
jgi:peptidyl-prolyl cis-trans isomerase C